MTDKELCHAIAALPDTARTLEDFLRAVLAALPQHTSAAGATPEQLLALLRAGTDGPLAPVPAARPPQTEDDEVTCLSELQDQLRRQIVDLRALRAAGAYDNEYRFYGLTAAGGDRWYNFEPRGYLSCACAGALGAHDDEEEALPLLDWGHLQGFFACGRCYE